MKKVVISAIVAIDEKRGIGKGNNLLFHIKEDFERMHKIIAGHPLIMGRKTHESIGRVLPDQANIVITRDSKYVGKHREGCIVAHSLEEALRLVFDSEGMSPQAQTRRASLAQGHEEVFIFGGGEIYQQAMPYIDRLYLTLVKGDFGADTFFPDYSDFKKVLFESEEKESDGFKYKFLDLER